MAKVKTWRVMLEVEVFRCRVGPGERDGEQLVDIPADVSSTPGVRGSVLQNLVDWIGGLCEGDLEEHDWSYGARVLLISPGRVVGGSEASVEAAASGADGGQRRASGPD
jgi:hypothetical protein